MNTIGGTPIKPMAERERRGDQLRDDMEAMTPAVTPQVWELLPADCCNMVLQLVLGVIATCPFGIFKPLWHLIMRWGVCKL